MVQARLMSRQYLLPWMTLGVLLFLAPTLRSQEVTVSGTPQQTNERIKELTSNSKPAIHDYVIGNGDLLNITVFDVPELARDVRVSQTGTISIPLVPVRLEVAGLSELQAEQKIAEVLESNGLVSHAEVGVVVKEHKSQPITIVGAVAHPMVYETDHPVTLLEVIAQAGGVSNDAGDTVIVNHTHCDIRRNSESYLYRPDATSRFGRACRSQALRRAQPQLQPRTTTLRRPLLSFGGRDGQESCPIDQFQSSACFGSNSRIPPIPLPSILTNSWRTATCGITSGCRRAMSSRFPTPELFMSWGP